jgi:iron complex outermembrane receptor protein
MQSKFVLALCGSASFFALTVAQPVVAQATDQPAAEASSSLEEIVVTARRREERVQSVPLAITAFSQNDIEEKHIQQVKDLANLVPSLAVSRSQADANAPYSSQTRLRGLPGSVVYFADVPLGNVDYQNGTGLTHGLSQGFYYDLQDLEVDKGPQGTLFGKNSVGGLISIQPKHPTNDFEGYGQVSFGNYGDKQVEGAINIPVIQDKLLVRIAGQMQQRDGYTIDQQTGKDYDNVNYYSWRVGVTLRPTDDFENYLVYDGYWQDSNGSSSIPRYVNPNFALGAVPLPIIGAVPLTLGNGVALSGLTNPATAAATFGQLLGMKNPSLAFFPNISSIITQQQQLGARAVLGRSVQGIGKDYLYGFTDVATWDINDNLTLKNIVAARIFKQLATTDDFGGPLPVLNIGNPGNNVEWGDNSVQYTEELQLQGKALDGKLKWILGGFLEFDHPLGDTLLASTAVANPAYYHFNEAARSQAAFITGTYDLSDFVEGMKFTAGYRYTWDYVSSEEEGTNMVPLILRNAAGIAQNCAPIVGFDNNCHISASGNFQSPGWNVSLDEQLTPDILLYVRSGNAYRPGGFNLNVPAADEKFQPEHVTDVELGTKADWNFMGVHGRTNFDIFHTDYKDIQVQELVSVVDAQGNTHVNSLYRNAATATLEGMEFEGTFVPLKGVEIAPHASYIFAQYDTYPQGFGVTATHPPFQYVPKWQWGVTGTYHLPIDEAYGDVAVSATYSWYGHQYLSIQSGEIFPIMPSYDQVDLRVDWSNIFQSTFDVAFWMTNALDTTHVAGGFPIYAQLGFTSLVYNEPQMFGFTLRYRFGPGTEHEEATAGEPVSSAPAPAPAPVQQAAKSYQVFFDFNKSALTAEGRTIVDQAAANAGSAHVTQITVTGHTDTVGSDAYNMRLSRRRAESVAAELEAKGVSSNEITLVAKGKRDLLVPTGDGVREPQNRRVEIVYGGGPTS